MPSRLIAKNSRLSEIAADDLDEIADFIARQQLASESVLDSQKLAARLRWIVLENPAREPRMPLGWCVRDEKGAVAGCICCAPQKFVFEGRVLTLMMSSSFYVDQRHRAAGATIFLKFLQMGKLYPLFASSTNAAVAEMWKKMGGSSIGNSDQEMLGVWRWRGVAEEALVRRLGNNSFTRTMTVAGSALLSMSKRLHTMTSTSELLLIERPEEAAKLCTANPSQLTSLRDAPYLRWRYFSEVDRSTRLFVFRAAAAPGEYLVAANLRPRGYRGQIRSINVLDVFPEPKAEIYPLIANSLMREYRNQADTLVFRCLSENSQRAVRQMGFLRRQFAAPIAWCFDKFQKLPSCDWYFVPADGDMFL